MVLPIVASAVAGAGIKTVLDKTVLKKNDKEDSKDDLCASANFVVSSDMNINHDADALKSRYLATVPTRGRTRCENTRQLGQTSPIFNTIDRETPV